MPTEILADEFALPSDILPLESDNSKEAQFTVLNTGPALRGSACKKCGNMSFPSSKTCNNCGSRDIENALFDGRGNLYSFSTIHISSTRQTPYTLGYVDLENGVRLLATIISDFANLKPDQKVELKASENEFWFIPSTEGE